MSALNTQVGGSHYKDCKIQPVEFIEANDIGFLPGCVVKRMARYDKPTGKGREDIEKAIHELQLLLELRFDKEDDASEVLETTPDNDGWIAWGGGESYPVIAAGTQYLFRRRDGVIGSFYQGDPSIYGWWHHGDVENDDDIVAYKLVDG